MDELHPEKVVAEFKRLTEGLRREIINADYWIVSWYLVRKKIEPVRHTLWNYEIKFIYVWFLEWYNNGIWYYIDNLANQLSKNRDKGRLSGADWWRLIIPKIE